MQLLKYLQAQGLGSRKQCQALIVDAAVQINGMVCTDTRMDIDPLNVSSLKIDEVNLTPVPLPHFYILLHKPADYETSHKPQYYPSVFSLLPEPLRHLDMQAVGRLDADTTGVLILTNDGQFNHRCTSPKHKLPKIYQVSLKHAADDKLCTVLKNGVLLHDDNETVQAEAAELIDAHTLLLTITSGKYHQVKRMVAAAGNRVIALHRCAFGSWQADDLPIGGWRFFQPESDQM
ncbi:16S rRNA pseudouridine(516) synthase [Snodgrassella gandavensis]|uniref:16S rRNA pseudouridine(516) synthase n=1 Tax=Snodgrassella gandavensis TaxID=2946698 RepID=UPI001EF66978|nr:pseudouridine synthase [Snodgrassella gandavensis]